jgi:alpha-beta hydrolase superfamily lysophospholipase
VRAARRLPDVRLADRTVVWGHSQGGGAALWVGEQARSYAPDVPLRGVAALAPASDVPALARELQTAAIGRLFATFVVQGYAHAYPDVRVGDYVRPSARTIVRRIVARCLSERTTLASIPPVLTRQTIFARDLRTGSLGRRAAQNVPARPSGVPTLVAQGLADRLVLPDVQARFVAGLCRAGQPVEYRTYRDRDHLALVAADSPLIADLLGWTERRLRGGRARTTCRTIGR